ncbi:MAG: hydantoinase/oxoprolinase family protein [Betaproteobacteria bacterium]|nr:hydantoinase/oxoprolinase family protein [Betaproteobacteria bacterium]
MARSLIAVDTGGTFTDLVAFDPERDEIRYTKSLTTHADPIRAIMDCVAKTEVALNGTAMFTHGTTLVVNTLIERSGPRIALVATRGFGDVVDLGRGNRTDQFDLYYRRDPALVRRNSRFELDERVDGSGNILESPSKTDVEAIAARIRELNISAVAISFLNSYIEPANERLVAGWLRELLPGCFVTASTELSREWYEFERTSTATANAYAGPKVGTYVRRLDEELRTREFSGQFLMMGSNGGMLSARQAAVSPVMLVESGPIGGCIGAGVYGMALGISNLIAFDMGGTTAKCAVVRDGEFDVVSTYHIGGYGRGIPIRTPVIDIVEVGAGGGSIAWLDEQRRLHVGPRSAGSAPGPACYGRGGLDPTVTDANLVLGRLNPERFQGGEMALDKMAARKAIRERLADPLGFSGEDSLYRLAGGIVEIAVVTMSGAIKRITVERGKDPRDFTLFCYGGGGPLHAVDLARELSIPRVLIPPEPGNFSAIGMLLADVRRDAGRTFLMRLDEQAIAPMRAVFEEIADLLRASLAENFAGFPIRIEHSAEMRFVGQFHTVRIKVTQDSAPRIQQHFEQEYLSRYGHLMRAGVVEFVSLHSAAFAAVPHPELTSIHRRAGTVQGQPRHEMRPVYFSDRKAALPTKVFAREALPAGFGEAGPAVIEEYGSTTIIGPADRFDMGSLGEIVIHVGA